MVSSAACSGFFPSVIAASVARIGPTVSDESGRLVFQCTVIRGPMVGLIVEGTSAATVASNCRHA